MEVIDSVLFSQLIMDFEACLEKIVKQLQLVGFPIERRHHCLERFSQLGSSVDLGNCGSAVDWWFGSFSVFLKIY